MAKNRPLRAVVYRLGLIETLIGEIIERKGHADVLEIGCGFGLPMLELRKKFGGRVSLTGINRDQKFNLPRRALWEGVRKRVVWPWEPLTFERRYGFPKYVNCDAGQAIPLADDSFDFVYSIACTFFVPDKLNLLKEVNRVLRPGCRARIHFSYWAGEACSPEQLPPTPYDSLCELQDASGGVVDTRAFLEQQEFLRFVEQPGGRPEYLELTKCETPIDFGMKFIDGYFLDTVNSGWVPYVRSIYQSERAIA